MRPSKSFVLLPLLPLLLVPQATVLAFELLAPILHQRPAVCAP